MSNRTTHIGGAALASGLAIVVIGVLTFPTMLFGGCTEVGTPEDQETDVGFLGFEDGRMHYTPDGGINECSIPLQFVLVLAGMMTVGVAMVIVGRSQ